MDDATSKRDCDFLAAGYALLANLLAVARKAQKHKDLTISAAMYFISLSVISEAVLMQRASVLYGFESTLGVEASAKQEQYRGPCLRGTGKTSIDEVRLTILSSLSRGLS